MQQSAQVLTYSSALYQLQPQRINYRGHMSDFNLEVTEFQIASEVKCNKAGNGVFSIRAVARLAGISDSSLSQSLKTGALLEPSKLAQFLIGQGFESALLANVNSTGIPDLLAAAVLEYYAFEADRYCTKQASLVYRAFARIGIRAYAQHITGWTPQEPIDYEQAIINVLREQIPEQPSDWQVRFIPAFWTQLERLYGHKRNENGCQQVIAAHIYRYFPIEVVERLDEINPIRDNGRRKNLQHQHFDKDLLVLLKNHIAKVTILMEGSATKADFLKAMRQIKKIRFNNSNVLYLDQKHSRLHDYHEES